MNRFRLALTAFAMIVVAAIILSCGTQENVETSMAPAPAPTTTQAPATTTTQRQLNADEWQFLGMWWQVENPPATTTTTAPPKAAAPKAQAKPSKPAVRAPAANTNYNADGSCAVPAYICQRESRGNYGAVNSSSGAGGKYQFMPRTWNATVQRMGRPDLVGVHPSQANPDDQDAAAAHLWNGGAGCSHWSAC